MGLSETAQDRCRYLWKRDSLDKMPESDRFSELRRIKDMILTELEETGDCGELRLLYNQSTARLFEISVCFWAYAQKHDNGGAEPFTNMVQLYRYMRIESAASLYQMFRIDDALGKIIHWLRGIAQREYQERLRQIETRREEQAQAERYRQEVLAKARQEAEQILREGEQKVAEILASAEEEVSHLYEEVRAAASVPAITVPAESCQPPLSTEKLENANGVDFALRALTEKLEQLQQELEGVCQTYVAEMGTATEERKEILNSLLQDFHTQNTEPLRDFANSFFETTESLIAADASDMTGWLDRCKDGMLPLIPKLNAALHAIGVEIYAPKQGEEFDPEFAESISEEDEPDEPVILRCITPGFRDETGCLIGERRAVVQLVERALLKGEKK